MPFPRGRVIQGSFPPGAMLPRIPPQQRPPIQMTPRGRATQLPDRFAPPPFPGRPLAPRVLQQMESLFRTRLADVRVHVGPHVNALGARAYTDGVNIHFAPGHYAPETPRGRELLAYELTHVVQQRTGRVINPFGRGTAVVTDHALEAEAQRMAVRARMPLTIVQPLITYDTKKHTFAKNAKRPGWFGWLKALYWGLRGDIAHVVSFKFIQDALLDACQSGDAGTVRTLAGRIADDPNAIDGLCDRLEAASGNNRKDIANQILSALNSSAKNTRKGGSSRVNRRIKQSLDPGVEATGTGYRFTDDTRETLALIDRDRDTFEAVTDDPRTLRLRRTHSGNRLHTSDFDDPIPLGRLSPKSKKRAQAFPWSPLDE